MINEVFAKANFGDRNPLGQHLTLWKGKKQAAARHGDCRRIKRCALWRTEEETSRRSSTSPYDQGYPEPDRMVYALRTAGDPLTYVNSVREIVRRADARVPVTDVRTQAADIDQTINQEIAFARLCTGFAILALVIACVGLYGTVSYNVARRTGEIGIRMALGAQRGSLFGWFCVRSSCWRRWGSRSACPRRWSRRNSSNRFCSA